MGVLFAETHEQIEKVVSALNRAGDRGEVVGLDTEFYGVEIGKQNCYARAKIHLISVAAQRFPTQVDVRGIPISDSAVFDRQALGVLSFISWLESSAPKAVHNLPVDAHAFANHGLQMGGGINTLALSRWAWPERARGRGFTLDSLGEDLLGAGKMEDFNELFSEEYEAHTSTFRNQKRCECGTPGCRKRQSNPGHSRILERVETVRTRIKTRPVPLESVVPDHPLWERALKYSAQDAVLAHKVYIRAMMEMEETIRHVPWI